MPRSLSLLCIPIFKPATSQERAEDIYRIVSQAVKAPLAEMVYAELL